MKIYSILVALAFGSCGLAQLVPDSDYHEIGARQRGGGGGGWGGGGWGGGGGGEGDPDTCEWANHCAGDTCDTENDCDGQLGCVNGECATVGAGAPATTAKPPVRTTARTTLRTTARPTPTPAVSCEWTDHCLGATCKTENDCDGQLGCVSGKCANVGANPVVSTPRPVQPTPTRPGVITVTDTRSAGTPAVPSPTRPVGGGGGSSPQPCGDSPLACIGASCKSDADCGFTLIICDNGVCGL